MPRINYLRIEEVIEVNQRLGCRGMINEGNLSFVLDEIRDLHESVERKATILLYKLIQAHPFLDGNKRTAFLSMQMFLRMNGKELIFNNAVEQLNKKLLYEIADNTIALETAEEILKDMIK